MTKLMGPEESEWVVPAEPTPLGIASDYTLLGIRHILEGLDRTRTSCRRVWARSTMACPTSS